MNGKTTWYLSMLELKLVANRMAVSIMNEMIKNEDRMKENETEADILNKSEEDIKQDCELNASKRLLPKFRESYLCRVTPGEKCDVLTHGHDKSLQIKALGCGCLLLCSPCWDASCLLELLSPFFLMGDDGSG